MKTVLAFFLINFLAVSSHAVVWKSSNNWSPSWESVYKKWVGHSWHETIFTDRSSPYFGIPTDCADASYAMRAIFAFENELPFAVTDPTKRSRRPLSNKMSRWDSEKNKYVRLKKFIQYLSKMVNTANLSDDTLPISIDSAALTSGLIYVKPRVHSYQIQNWTRFGLPVTLNSTTPYSIQELSLYTSFPSYVPRDTVRFTDGYRRFKHPTELYQPNSRLPGYSLEQFELSEKVGFDPVEFNEIVRERMQVAEEPVRIKTKRLMTNLCFSLYNRENVVNQGVVFREKMIRKGRQCMNRQEFDQYSTFVRDERLKQQFLNFENFVTKTKKFQGYEFPLKHYAIGIFSDDLDESVLKKEDFLNYCSVQIGEGKTKDQIGLRTLWQRIDLRLLVQNPNATALERWGGGGEPFVSSCPTYVEVH